MCLALKNSCPPLLVSQQPEMLLVSITAARRASTSGIFLTGFLEFLANLLVFKELSPHVINLPAPKPEEFVRWLYLCCFQVSFAAL
jgi:hypothetical protein